MCVCISVYLYVPAYYSRYMSIIKAIYTMDRIKKKINDKHTGMDEKVSQFLVSGNHSTILDMLLSVKVEKNQIENMH